LAASPDTAKKPLPPKKRSASAVRPAEPLFHILSRLPLARFHAAESTGFE